MPETELLHPPYQSYRVQPDSRKAGLEWLLGGLEAAGCRILERPRPARAPFPIVLELPVTGERIGVLAYLFNATARKTRNRPADEARFQVKYEEKRAKDDDNWHDLLIDPTGLWVTLFAGIDVERGMLVAADPLMHNPTRFFISVEYKVADAERAATLGWHWWERDKRSRGEPIEVLVGCGRERLLDLVLFERAAQGLSPGHRGLLADDWGERGPIATALREAAALLQGTAKEREPVPGLLEELAVDRDQLLEIIQRAPRLLTAVRGWVAEHHLAVQLSRHSEVAEVSQLESDGSPDLRVALRADAGPERSIHVECKNVLRRPGPGGVPRVDFQRTRAAKGDPCSRYYKAEEFHVVAACLHPLTRDWEFRFKATSEIQAHPRCEGRLHDRLLVDESWSTDLVAALARA
jgi:hypothetical protein